MMGLSHSRSAVTESETENDIAGSEQSNSLEGLFRSAGSGSGRSGSGAGTSSLTCGEAVCIGASLRLSIDKMAGEAGKGTATKGKRHRQVKVDDGRSEHYAQSLLVRKAGAMKAERPAAILRPDRIWIEVDSPWTLRGQRRELDVQRPKHTVMRTGRRSMGMRAVEEQAIVSLQWSTWRHDAAEKLYRISRLNSKLTPAFMIAVVIDWKALVACRCRASSVRLLQRQGVTKASKL